MIRDASFDSTGILAYGGKASGFLGTEPMVNGTLALDVTRSLYRFRIVNAATARIFRLSLGGLPMHFIGNDGGLLPARVEQTTMDVSPGERLDVLVDFGPVPAQTRALRCELAGWTLLEFRLTGSPAASASLPTALSAITQLPAPAAGATRRISFDGMTRVNGKVYDERTALFEVKAGVVEDWTFTTNGNAPHPVHVHGASFQCSAGRAGGAGPTRGRAAGRTRCCSTTARR